MSELFPESEGDQGDLDAFAQAQALEKLVGLPVPEPRTGQRLGVGRVQREGDRLRVVLSGGVVEGLVAFLSPPGQGATFLRAPGFGLAYAGSELSPAARRFLEALAARLGRWSFEALCEHLRAAVPPMVQPPPPPAPPMGSPPEPSPHESPRGEGSSGSHAPSAWSPPPVTADGLPVEEDGAIGFDFALPHAWRNFLQERENNYGSVENDRGYCTTFGPGMRILSHTDIECHYSAPPRYDGGITFWNHLRLGTIEDKGGGPFASFFTDMEDQDVIKGGGPTLDRTLDAIAAQLDGTELLTYGATCLINVIGDDVDKSLERFSKKTRLPIVRFDSTVDPRQRLVEAVRAEPGFDAVPRVPGAVNLLGFPWAEGAEGFRAMLAEAGVTVNARLLPELDPAAMRRYRAAELDVIYDWPDAVEPARRLFGALGTPTVVAPPPVGVEGTRRCFLAIGAALGRDRAFEAVWARRHAAVAGPWAQLRAACEGYRVAFVGAAGRIDDFLADRELLGLPALASLREMGFEVEVWRMQTPRSTPLRDLGPVTARWFASPAELEAMLRESDVAAVYSEMYFDRRLSRCGKSAFSIQDLGFVGLDGALSMLRRMRSRCEASFYRSYGRYLGSAFGPG